MTDRPFTLLLVDDELADALMFRELLSEIDPGIRLSHVRDGREAVEYLERSETGDPDSPRPSLVMLDLNMPVMNGHEFLQWAKVHDSFKTLPVVVLSTSQEPADVETSYQHYANSYLVKPASATELQRLINVVLDYWRGAVNLPTIRDLEPPGYSRRS